MAHRQTNDIEATGTLNEYRDENGVLQGIQLYMEDDRSFSDVLIDWMISNGYSLENPKDFLKSTGLDAQVSVDDWTCLLCGVKAPGKHLAQALAAPISDALNVTKAGVASRAARARRECPYQQVEIAADVTFVPPPKTVKQKLDAATQKGSFGELLQAHMDKKNLSQTDLRQALREQHCNAGGNVSRWLDGSRAPKPTTLIAIAHCLGLSTEERDQFIARRWGNHRHLWGNFLKQAAKKMSFGDLFRAHYHLCFNPATQSPYTYETLPLALGVSSNKIIAMEQNRTFPSAELFERMVQVLDLSPEEASRLAVAVSVAQEEKRTRPLSKIDLLTRELSAGESPESYTELAKLYRQATGLNVIDAAQQFGVKRDLINFLEQGKRIARPETRQILLSYLNGLGMPDTTQELILHHMDYTNLGIAGKQAELAALTANEPFAFGEIFRLCRETTPKADGGCGLISHQEAADLLMAQTGKGTCGTIRNWERSIGTNQPTAEGKMVNPALLQKYMDIIQVPEPVQEALLAQLQEQQFERNQRKSDNAGKYQTPRNDNPRPQITDTEAHGPLKAASRTR